MNSASISIGNKAVAAITIGGIPLPCKEETGNILIVGSPGSGKTTGIHEILPTIRKRGERAVVLDADYLMHVCYSRPGDIVIKGTEPPDAAVLAAWAEKEEGDSWVFVLPSLDAHGIVPYKHVDAVIEAILSITPSFSRRIWLALDGVAGLSRTECLARLLASGQDYGLASIVASHSIPQLDLRLFNTILALHCGNPERAYALSELFGNGPSSSSPQQVTRRRSYEQPSPLAVLPDEILNLPCLSGFLFNRSSIPARLVKVSVSAECKAAAAGWRMGDDMTAIWRYWQPTAPQHLTEPPPEFGASLDAALKVADAEGFLNGLNPYLPVDDSMCGDGYVGTALTKVAAGLRQFDLRLAVVAEK